MHNIAVTTIHIQIFIRTDQSKWEQYYIVEGKKKESTMLRLRPATFSGKGKAGYEWQQFYLTKDGKEHVTDEDSIIYDPDAVTQEDVDKMGAFIDHLWKNRLEKAECLISTYEYLDKIGRASYTKKLPSLWHIEKKKTMCRRRTNGFLPNDNL